MNVVLEYILIYYKKLKKQKSSEAEYFRNNINDHLRVNQQGDLIGGIQHTGTAHRCKSDRYFYTNNKNNGGQ